MMMTDAAVPTTIATIQFNCKDDNVVISVPTDIVLAHFKMCANMFDTLGALAEGIIELPGVASAHLTFLLQFLIPSDAPPRAQWIKEFSEYIAPTASTVPARTFLDLKHTIDYLEITSLAPYLQHAIHDSFLSCHHSVAMKALGIPAAPAHSLQGQYPQLDLKEASRLFDVLCNTPESHIFIHRDPSFSLT
jgi:hypothetical protein